MSKLKKEVLKISNIVHFSGGKDSTAMLLMMLKKNINIDEIIFCDTGKEFPEMYNHIEQVRNYICKNYNKDITILKPNKDFNYYMFDHIKTKGKNKGQKGYGWASIKVRWCTTLLKQNVANRYLKSKKYKNCIHYIGIAFDEPNRHQKKKDNIIHPLYNWRITEQKALEYCYSMGFYWGGLYNDFKRLSCYCCPFKNMNELKTIYIKYPKIWNELKEMDKKSINKFKANYSIEDLEKKFNLDNLSK